MKIEVGQIWKVLTDNFRCGKVSSYIRNESKIKFEDRKLLLQNGEYIEIRYPYEWNFRTRDDIYLDAKPEEILNNCRYIGKIMEPIRWRNQNKLDGILTENLYDKPEQSSENIKDAEVKND